MLQEWWLLLCIPTNAISKQLQLLQVHLHMYECKFLSWENAFPRVLQGFCTCVCVCVFSLCVLNAEWCCASFFVMLPCNISRFRSIFRSNKLLISERSAIFQPDNNHQTHHSTVLLTHLEIKQTFPSEIYRCFYNIMLVQCPIILSIISFFKYCVCTFVMCRVKIFWKDIDLIL